MTPSSVVRRPSSVMIVAAMAISASAAPQKHDHASLGEIIRASRLIGSMRLDEARHAIADLVKKSPDQPEVKWLEAELAFHDGDYTGALKDLDGVSDDAVDGEAGATRSLAANTLAVTNAFVHKDSPGGHFTIYYAPGPDELMVDLAGETLDKAWDRIGDDLGWKPTEKIRVEILGRPSDLSHLSTLTEQEIETTGTIALSKYGKLMVVSPRATVLGYPWMDTLAHEYTHLVVSHISHDQVPVWLQEGLARFEQERWRSDPPFALPGSDQRILASAIKNRRLIGFDEMGSSFAKLPTHDAAALSYAEVFTLVAWIHSKVGYEGLRELIVKQQTGKSARRAIAEALDTQWPKVEQGWQQYLHTLDLSAGRTARDKRIRFAKGGHDEDNVGLDAVASAKAKKHARLGGMLRARGMLDAAAIEYEKGLTASPGDPFIGGKLARTYVELGKHDRAIELAKPIAAADDADPTPAVTLGIAYAARGDWEPAAGAFEQALRITPFDPAVRCGLADVYEHTSDPRAAREHDACDRLRQH
ncbi:MAG TPA: tetratricopeptide repeat protein [Kofleriaceae bacterium]|nr:tetratricopeptide repeat protein [Kofleriaceae bacterium]